MEKRTLVMLAAGALLVYGMLRSNDASAATVEDPGSMDVLGGVGGGGGGGGSGSSIADIVNRALDSVAGAIESRPQGTATPGPLPVAQARVEDAPRAAAVVDVVTSYRDPSHEFYGLSTDPLKRAKQESSD